jgi:predicted TIM-barrel fold metal-dependent hydrolase
MLSCEPTAFTDTHVHFWDLRNPTLRYSWLESDSVDPRLGDIGGVKSLRYWPDDFEGETRFVSISKIVHVQGALGSADPVEETRWLQGFADKSGVPHGIVAYVDLASPEADATIKRHAEYANFRGVRDFRRDNYLENDAWRHGYKLLEEYGLVCCDDPPMERMASVGQFVRDHPGAVYCLDHAGYPTRRDRTYFHDWRAALRALARVDNTIVKISALGTYDRSWTIESMRPWVLECIEAWGADRVILGTNWPVDRLFSSYGDLVDAYRAIISDLSLTEQTAILNGNANRVFKLD